MARHRIGRSTTAALLAATLWLVAAACSTVGTPTAAPIPSTPAASLAAVPAGTGQVEIVDMEQAKKRWQLGGVDGTTDPDSADGRAYLQHLTQEGAGTDLDTYFQLFRDAGFGWSGWDVQWEARSYGSGPTVSVYKLRDTLDMQTVVRSFETEGMQRSGTDDAVRFDGRLSADAVLGRVFLSGATVIPSRHLLVAATADGWHLPADAASLAADPAVTALTSGLGPADYWSISVGAKACVTPAAVLGTATTPAQVKEFAATFAGLTPITGAVVTATGPSAATVVTGYSTDAAGDLEARRSLLTGPSLATRQPYTDLFTAQVTANGTTLRYQLDGERAGSRVRQMVARADTPWAFCP